MQSLRLATLSKRLGELETVVYVSSCTSSLGAQVWQEDLVYTHKNFFGFLFKKI
jgi:hypothetical protein